MHLSNLLLLPLVLQSVTAAPTQNGSTALDAPDTEHVIVEHFTASDGETYEIVSFCLLCLMLRLKVSQLIATRFEII